MDRKRLVESFTQTLEKYGGDDETPSHILADMLVTHMEVYQDTVARRGKVSEESESGYSKPVVQTMTFKPKDQPKAEYVQAVQLKATEPGDHLIFSHTPEWLKNALENMALTPILGDLVDGSDWVYISMPGTTSVCRSDDWVVRDEDGNLYFERTGEILNRYSRVKESEMTYRKKPVMVQALQTGGEKTGDVYSWLSEAVGIVNEPKYYGELKLSLPTNGVCYIPEDDVLIIYTLEGPMKASPGDWVIRGVAGEFYPCKPDIFKETYEHVES